jgi:hypothetical protein
MILLGCVAVLLARARDFRSYIVMERVALDDRWHHSCNFPEIQKELERKCSVDYWARHRTNHIGPPLKVVRFAGTPRKVNIIDLKRRHKDGTELASLSAGFSRLWPGTKRRSSRVFLGAVTRCSMMMFTGLMLSGWQLDWNASLAGAAS